MWPRINNTQCANSNCQRIELPYEMLFLETVLNSYWLLMLTHICVGPHPLTVSQTGMLRYGQVSLELTGRRMSASPCWLSLTHPRSVTEGETRQRSVNLIHVASAIVFVLLCVLACKVVCTSQKTNWNNIMRLLCSPATFPLDLLYWSFSLGSGRRELKTSIAHWDIQKRVETYHKESSTLTHW